MLFADVPAWGPEARGSAGFVFDEGRDRWVLFGGRRNSSCPDLADTWEFDGATWTLTISTGPAARYGFAMAYDRLRQQTVLFGGHDCNGVRGDTWVLTPSGWQQRSPVNSPPARGSLVGAFDAGLGAFVIHGGVDQQGAALTDTWSWDGTNWQQIATGPACVEGAIAFDEHRRRTVLLVPPSDNRVYELVGGTWQLVTSANMSGPRTAAVFDRRLDTVLVFGGVSGCYTTNSLQGFDGSRWEGFGSPTSAPSRDGAMLAQRPRDGALVLFGGGTWSCWGWSFDGSTYLLLPYRVSNASINPIGSAGENWRSGHAVAPNPAGGLLSFGGSLSGQVTLDTKIFQNGYWQRVYPLQTPSWRTGHGMATDPQRRFTVLFGGLHLMQTTMADTWLWDGVDWLRLPTVGGPPARQRHAMAWSADAGRVLLHGGLDAAGQHLDDFWSFDGTMWHAFESAARPPARADHGLAEDTLRHRVVLAGGSDGNGGRRDVWEWDGVTWTRPSASDLPRRASNSAPSTLAYDPRAERIVTATAFLDGCENSVWSWDGRSWTSNSPWRNYGSMKVVYEPQQGTVMATSSACHGNDQVYEIVLPTYSRFAYYGTGCAGSAGVPRLTAEAGSMPVYGQPFRMQLSNLPNTPFNFVYGIVGFSSTSWLGGPLPRDLGFVGLPGCTSYTSVDFSTVLPLANPQGSSTWALSIPGMPSLLGTFVYLQGMVYDFQPAGRWAAVSNAISARIGNS